MDSKGLIKNQEMDGVFIGKNGKRKKCAFLVMFFVIAEFLSLSGTLNT